MFDSKIKIALTGIAGGGKTVFLSSLIAQLSEFDSAYFTPINSVKIHNYRDLPIKSNKWKQFKSEKYIECLSRGCWPEKTTASAKHICEYSRSDWEHSFSLNRFFKQSLEFFDFPGERIADAAIAAYKDYATWSEHILQHFNDHHEYKTHLEEYLKALNSRDEHNLNEIIEHYKLLLAHLITDYKPLVTPSTFLLSPDGKVAKAAHAEEIAKTQICGMTKDSEFAPIPAEILSANPDIIDKMSAAYKEYRSKIALPLFSEILSAETLIILIDIPSLLAGGVDRYNDNRQILLDLFESLRSDSLIGKLLKQLISLFKGRLKRVAFVATKMDMVAKTDIENGKLRGLLKLMTQRARRTLPDTDFEWFTCSACYSTRPSEKSHHLIGKLSVNNPGQEWIEYPVPPLPEIWPEDWDYNDYPFYSILPDAPRNMQIPPNHSGLDRIFDFITGGR